MVSSIPNDFMASSSFNLIIVIFCGGTLGVMVIVVGNRHGDTSSNSGRDWLPFTLH